MKTIFIDCNDQLDAVFARVYRPDDPPITINTTPVAPSALPDLVAVNQGSSTVSVLLAGAAGGGAPQDNYGGPTTFEVYINLGSPWQSDANAFEAQVTRPWGFGPTVPRFGSRSARRSSRRSFGASGRGHHASGSRSLHRNRRPPRARGRLLHAVTA